MGRLSVPWTSRSVETGSDERGEIRENLIGRQVVKITGLDSEGKI
jgi:hypothetical protein